MVFNRTLSPEEIERLKASHDAIEAVMAEGDHDHDHAVAAVEEKRPRHGSVAEARLLASLGVRHASRRAPHLIGPYRSSVPIASCDFTIR